MSNDFTRTADAITAITQLTTPQQLRDVYRAVQQQERYISRQTIRAVTQGALVSFVARNGSRVVGKVTKVNRKTCEVLGGMSNGVFNTRYKVPASMLTVEEAA